MKKSNEKILIAAFAFGESREIFPNRRLASIAEECSSNFKNYLIVTQDDIAVSSKCNVVYVKNKPARPATTLMVACEAVNEALGQGIMTIYIVAGRPHLWRCIRDVKQLIQEAGANIEVRVAPRIKRSNYWSWFDKKSVQFRTQSPLKGFWYEPLFRIIPFWLYKNIAG